MEATLSSILSDFTYQSDSLLQHLRVETRKMVDWQPALSAFIQLPLSLRAVFNQWRVAKSGREDFSEGW